MYKFTNVSFSIASGALLIAGCSLLFNSTTAGAAPDGSKIFAENCAACHKDGGNIVDAKKPVKGSKILASQKAFKDYLLKPAGSMPPQEKIAKDDADCGALYKYCKSLK